MKMPVFDAAVIGGGLAGCNAAIHLAQKGHRVVLLEAGHYPRVKVCGEFLSPECVALADEAGFLNSLRALHPVPIHTLRITAHHEQAWQTTLPAPAWGISRFALDSALAHHASAVGVSVHTNCAVRHVEGDLERGFTLTTSTSTPTSSHPDLQPIRARTLIAAYGRHSKLDATQPRGTTTHHRHPSGYIALKQHFAGPSLGNHLDLYVFRGGYCGMSQVEDGNTNVCLMVQQHLFQQIAGQGRGGLAQFIHWMRQQSEPLDRWLAKATPIYAEWLSIANVSLASKPPTHHDVLYAGDAAGMIAPLAGDGMAMALHSGKLAAQAIHPYLTGAQTAPAVVRAYAREWQHSFARRLKLGRLLQAIMLYPRLLAPALTLMNQVPAVGNWLIQHTRDLNLLKSTP